jgi:hypothetical protein
VVQKFKLNDNERKLIVAQTLPVTPQSDTASATKRTLDLGTERIELAKKIKFLSAKTLTPEQMLSRCIINNNPTDEKESLDSILIDALNLLLESTGQSDV